ncbi:FAD-dependent oxidoreductase [Thiolapillus sp.]|uniref:FAD-dependent oxidoreductase n=3 Tax=Thiolapillus sp. TaxID=2017437 RepID=UPI0025EDFEAD|nr:FAD-dependent oxidoreductase [Thiolapillus sp.]
MNTVRPDLLIFGGGIAGLWTLLRARQAGYSVLLLESRVLGGVQSIASQGIIHGGTKYALKGRLSGSAQSIAAMPGIWRACLQGKGELDLSAVRLLSGHQYLWSSGSLSSGVAGLFASKLMRSRVQAVSAPDLPAPFDAPGFHGSLYRLQEPVLDTASLMHHLADQALPYCWKYDPADLSVENGMVRIGDTQLQPGKILLTAGEGNAGLLAAWGLKKPKMQKRPLHMVMLKARLPAIFAHCLGASANPRLTITSYPLGEGKQIWYLGGQLAEEGVRRDTNEQIAAAGSELARLLPWVAVRDAAWATLPIQRAEVATPGGKRPQESFVGEAGDLLVAWPTKLAFAPRLAAEVLARLKAAGQLSPDGGPFEMPLSRPALASLPWETVRSWS